MRGAVLVQVGQPLEIMDLVIPELSYGQVLVDMHYSGVCRSQLMEADGHRGYDRWLPHLLGHEGVGEVTLCNILTQNRHFRANLGELK